MFQGLLRSLSGSLAELTKWEPSGRGEPALRLGLDKTLLFTLCASAIVGVSTIVLGVTQQSVFCDKGLAFWNGGSGVLLLALAAACAQTLFFDSKPVKLASSLIMSNCETSYYEYGTGALATLIVLAGSPLLALLWSTIGYVDVISSPTCRSTAALLYGGTITNICLIFSTVSIATLMTAYFVATTKGFYDIAILKCICDPLGIVVEGVARRMPDAPRISIPAPQIGPIRLPGLTDLKNRLPTYEELRSMVRRIVESVVPRKLPDPVNALLSARAY